MTSDRLSARRFTTTALLAGATLLGGWAWLGTSQAAENAVSLPPPAFDTTAQASRETAVFAGGCFWGMQAVFQHTQGVLGAVSGYAGGDQSNATYERVSSGRSGHAEAVQVVFDPRQISYGKLLQIYFSVAHDPTEVNRQGPDSGPQYRSAVFYQGAQQQQVTQRYIAQLDQAHLFGRKIATQVAPLTAFYPAEAYHQDYATLHPESGYIATYDLPKIANLKRLFATVYREKPVLVGAAAGS
jgi:peptide-methionine (S)-S-oxide reductase